MLVGSMNFKLLVLSPLFLTCILGATSHANAQDNPSSVTPSLVVTNKALPPEFSNNLYYGPRRQPDITAAQITGDVYRQNVVSLVTRQIGDLQKEYDQIQARVQNLSGGLNALQSNAEQLSAQYYANVATINTQLQTGTTPGNPRMVAKLTEAQRTLEGLSENIARLNSEAIRISSVANDAAFLLDATRSAFGLSGAIEEDHVALSMLEDQIQNSIVAIERMLGSVNDQISRTTAYLSSERENLRTLSLAVSKGDYFGTNISNRTFASAADFSTDIAPAAMYQPASLPAGQMVGAPPPPPSAGSNVLRAPSSPNTMAGNNAVAMPPAPVVQASIPRQMQPSVNKPAERRPLARIEFTDPDVEFEQSLYVAVNEALQRYPDAQFDLVAVYPAEGNAAEIAIETTRARRNAEKVLRTLTQMGLEQRQIDLSYDESQTANNNEVHVYIR